MNFLPEDIEDIIMDYKEQFERAELDNKIKKNCEKINNIRKICIDKEYIIRKSTEAEVHNTSSGFDIKTGRHMNIDYHYKGWL